MGDGFCGQRPVLLSDNTALRTLGVCFKAPLFSSAPAVGKWSIVMSMYVCLSASVSAKFVREHISGTTCPQFAEFSVRLTHDRGPILNLTVVTRCVLPGFRMTSFLLCYAQWPRIGDTKKSVYAKHLKNGYPG